MSTAGTTSHTSCISQSEEAFFFSFYIDVHNTLKKKWILLNTLRNNRIVLALVDKPPYEVTLCGAPELGAAAFTGTGFGSANTAVFYLESGIGGSPSFSFFSYQVFFVDPYVIEEYLVLNTICSCSHRTTGGAEGARNEQVERDN